MLQNAMDSVVFWMLMFAVVTWLAFSLRGSREQWQRLADELEVRLPVFAAETTQGKEAEFIRERLPKRLRPAALVLGAALLVAGAVIAWLLA